MLRIVNGKLYDYRDGHYCDLNGSGRGWVKANEDWDFKNLARAYFWLDESFSDQRVNDWLYEKKTFSLEEYRGFLDSINRSYYDRRAEELLRFIFNYAGGLICPNRWNTYEPVNKKFDASDTEVFNEMVKQLSFPMGSLLYKRVNAVLRCEIEVSNGDGRPYFSISGWGKNKKAELIGDFTKRDRGESNIVLGTKLSELKKIKKDPIEFFDEFAAALKEEFALYKYYMYIEKDFSFYRRPDKEVIYYDIPETHKNWRDD